MITGPRVENTLLTVDGAEVASVHLLGEGATTTVGVEAGVVGEEGSADGAGVELVTTDNRGVAVTEDRKCVRPRMTSMTFSSAAQCLPHRWPLRGRPASILMSPRWPRTCNTIQMSHSI